MCYESLFESLCATLKRKTGSLPFLALDPYTEDVIPYIEIHDVIQEQIHIQD